MESVGEFGNKWEVRECLPIHCNQNLDQVLKELDGKYLEKQVVGKMAKGGQLEKEENGKL